MPIYEVVSDGKTHFLVMEFVEGWNLRDFVKIRKKVEPLQATRLMIDMAEGLRYAFEHGLTHRDLKLNNVLVSSTGQAKLVDFGLAALDETIADDALADIPNTRTIDYAALERATGVRKDDTRSDIYFLGCIFYHMLTGQAPLSETRDRLQRLSSSVSWKWCRSRSSPRRCRIGSPWWSTRRWTSIRAGATSRLRRCSPICHIAATQLAGRGATGAAASDRQRHGRRGHARAREQHSVMVVESNQKMQDIFREGFKRAGYRVLLTSDPARAVGRFRQDDATADCVLFSTIDLAERALETFNRLARDEKTMNLRAVLLLGEDQRVWKPRAVAGPAMVLALPLTFKDLARRSAACWKPCRSGRDRAGPGLARQFAGRRGLFFHSRQFAPRFCWSGMLRL